MRDYPPGMTEVSTIEEAIDELRGQSIGTQVNFNQSLDKPEDIESKLKKEGIKVRVDKEQDQHDGHRGGSSITYVLTVIE